MTLEDHAGDVARKARLMNGTSLGAVLALAKVSPEAWEQFEREGRVPAGLPWEAVASVLGLHADRWRALAGGWLPRAVDLSAWHEFRVYATVGGGMVVNAYLAWDPETREAALFDTGFEAAPILECVAQHGLRPQHLFLTHSHHDHVAALEPLRTRFPALRLHTDYPGAPASQRNRPGDVVAVGRLKVAYRATPGHADDGATYVISGFGGGVGDAAVVGDALFAGSMGGAPGKGELARRQIRDAILSLAEDTLICPGHGPLTTVGEVLASHPFFP